ncbi:MAG: MBL fold metallo-hydrolase [Caldilineales bacterium]|nr:MBL fold metallo-hydrolase [Caldilineales bacterium]MDW8317356.1 MBL fold metallo-hydrolase [Anaerolineae bacterium]
MQTLPVDPFDMPILGKIHRITLPTPFPVGPVHTYLVEGEPLTLIDTGPATPEAWEALLVGLRQHGYAPADLERIIVTHAHTDHFGLVGRLVDLSGAEVWSSRQSQPWLEDAPGFHEQRKNFWYEMLAACGVPLALAEPSARLYASFRRLQTYAAVTRFLQEGDRFEMAGLQWETLYCPGHSSSLLCFYQPRSRLLVGNDHLLAHITSNAIVEPPPQGETGRRRPLIEYWRSLRRVYELELDLVLTGHEEAVADPCGLIKERFRFYERRLGRLRQLLAAGPRTVWELAQAIFRQLDNVDVFLAASEIVGHLDVLEEQGEVVVHVDDGIWRYELATVPVG